MPSYFEEIELETQQEIARQLKRIADYLDELIKVKSQEVGRSI